MSSLREIKDRIGSVRSTLKITNAMKLVSSAKLRKAQQAIEALRPYEATLSAILAEVNSGEGAGFSEVRHQKGAKMQHPPVFSEGGASIWGENASASRVAVVAVASNSSLCGSFNGNVLRKTLEVLKNVAGEATPPSGVRPSDSPHHPSGAVPPLPCRGWHVPQGEHLPVCVDVYPIGRRIADPLRKAGFPAARDLNDLATHPSYEAASELAQSLTDAYAAGVYSKVILIYNHFVTASRQEVVCETYLPWNDSPTERAENVGDPGSEEGVAYENGDFCGRYIVEPSPSSVAETLLPQVMRLKIYAMLLDSAAAEHAARMIAMQTATDNAQDILDELTLEYNKGRQQQITAEILDIVGGSQQ